MPFDATEITSHFNRKLSSGGVTSIAVYKDMLRRKKVSRTRVPHKSFSRDGCVSAEVFARVFMDKAGARCFLGLTDTSTSNQKQ